MKRARAPARVAPVRPAPAPPAAATWTAPLAAALAMVAALALRARAPGAPFFADDYLFLDQVRARSLPAALFAPDPLGNFLRPVGRALWFWVLAHLGGESPALFHVANLALFALALALLFALVRALAGVRAAAVATAFVALSHVPDVAVRWASGAQDLLALTLALGALLLHRAGRRAWAAAALVLALLAKESVAATPLIAVLVARRADERWRDSLGRAWPLFAATAGWAALWLATAHARAGAAAVLSFTPASLPAALVHLVQSALGAEWVADAPQRAFGRLPALVPLALALAAVGAAQFAPPARPAAGAAFDPRWTGAAWALLGALPVALVAPIWSAYFYLFALCGAGLALGATLSRAPWWAALLAVAALAWPAAGARALDEFAQSPDPWSTLSHVNPHYLARAEANLQSMVGQLRAERPTLRPGTTVFFSGVPAWTGVQAGGGPLVRWMYRDSSLEAHFTSRFSLANARGGPLLFVGNEGGRLTVTEDGAGTLTSLSIMLLTDDAVTGARDAMLLRERRVGARADGSYALAWMSLALGDTLEARRRLLAVGAQPRAGARAEVEAALAEVARGDTAAAYARMGRACVTWALDPGAHALLADLALSDDATRLDGVLEAFVTRVLAPEWPDAWRRWAQAQLVGRRTQLALRSLDRYFELAGPAGLRDTAAVTLRDELRRETLGGDLVRQSLRTATPLLR